MPDPPASRIEDAELGLWLTHQLGIDVALIYSDDGFTVRLRGGTITATATSRPDRTQGQPDR